MTDKWDELHRKELQLSYQLEDVEYIRFRAKQVLDDFENYDHHCQFTSIHHSWEAAEGSRYAGQLEEHKEHLLQLKNQVFELFSDSIDELNHQARQLEDDIEAIYLAKRKEDMK